tara:strand:- start:41 stop:637 length:597 start_codon:yes stop_codon:yes gene_type:complete
MITFKKLPRDKPYRVLKEFYDCAVNKNQKNIEAICISSFSKENNQVNSRFVNLKFVEGNEFIFFSNYESPKSIEFSEHNQISATIFWNSINTQIRFKAKILKIDKKRNQAYFLERSAEKNALAISSKQSREISSYKEVKDNYITALKNQDLTRCPNYWGGFSFVPFEIEFWEGHDFRLNKREKYFYKDDAWKKILLEP